jgi:hypothetical protein
MATAPAIALPLGLALPGTRREYVGALRLPDIYRGSLSGSPDLDLSLSSFSIRRDTAGVSLSAVVPASSAELVAAIVARADETLTLLRGVRFRDGTEQVEPMLSVPLDGGVRYDIGTKSASVTLSGQTAETATRGPETRALQGISYRSESNGSRRVRCAIDTYLRPGDTADLGGGETMTIAEMVYSCDARQGTMEVAE